MKALVYALGVIPLVCTFVECSASAQPGLAADAAKLGAVSPADGRAINPLGYVISPASAAPPPPRQEGEVRAPMLHADKPHSHEIDTLPTAGRSNGGARSRQRYDESINRSAEGTSSSGYPRRPIALAATPSTPPPEQDAFQRSTTIPALLATERNGALATYLRESWQQAGFIAILVALGGLIFGWLGTRGRQANPESLEFADYEIETATALPEENLPPSRPFPTLREAVDALKAERSRQL